jgi:hypothetical protein
VTPDLDITMGNPASYAAAQQYNRLCLPYHEASHCVVAHHFGIAVRYVTISREEAVEATGDPGAVGHTALASYAGPAGHLAMVALAGIVSDGTFGAPGVILEGDPSAALAAAAAFAGHDLAQFCRLLPLPAAQREVIVLTRSLLRERRADVVAVGRALLEKGRLTGEDLACALQRVDR